MSKVKDKVKDEVLKDEVRYYSTRDPRQRFGEF